jgi:polyhydroxyalkanoate synthase
MIFRNDYLYSFKNIFMEQAESVKINELTNQLMGAGEKLTQDFVENFPTYIQSSQDFMSPFISLSTKIMSDPESMKNVQNSYLNFLQSQMELSKNIYDRQLNKEKKIAPVIVPTINDRRFKAPEWNEYPFYFDFIKQNYLLVSELITKITGSVELEKKSKDKLSFYTQQCIDALSPTNFFITNPEAIKLAKDTQGKSLIDGFNNLLADIEKGRITQTDNSAFEVGVNLAITKGSVVFENEIMQLIQYAPLTAKVAEYPLLMIPPWINKYYILDLHPDKSLVEFAVKKGNTVFMISWKNPTRDMGNLSFDDYVEKGAMKAIEVAKKITRSAKINTLGYCLGGTLLGTTLAILRSKSKLFPAAKALQNSVNSVTLLATMLDFSDIGPMGAIIDEQFVEKMEVDLKKEGILKGTDMADAFNAIRANELVWNYVSNNYLKGKTPPAFNVLFWTDDNTNLPAEMYIFYLRKLLLENKLSKKNALKICDVPIDLSNVDTAAFIIGTIDDHIAPCTTAFTTTQLFTGPVEFVLGDSGHIMGAINPPSVVHKYHYNYGGKLDEGFDTWKATAKQGQGSWWVYWEKWLNNKSGKQIPAPKMSGSIDFNVIEPAPGRYVKEKC